MKSASSAILSRLMLSWILCGVVIGTASAFVPSSVRYGGSSVAFVPHRPTSATVEMYGLKDRFGKVVRSVIGRGKEEENMAAVGVMEKPALETAADPTKELSAVDETCEPPEEMTETQKLMKQVKDAGVAGIISYALWEVGFWAVSVPVVVFGYREVAGHWPDFSNSDDMAKLGAEAFAFVNFARFAVPLRIGLALSTTPWIQSNIVDRFFAKKEDECDPAAATAHDEQATKE
jgi:hypothetical protein